MKYLKSALILLLFFYLPETTFAQDVIYSQYDKYDFRAGDYAVVGMTGGLLYNYRNTSDGAMLDAYDDSMNKTATVLLDFFPEKMNKYSEELTKSISASQVLEAIKDNE